MRILVVRAADMMAEKTFPVSRIGVLFAFAVVVHADCVLDVVEMTAFTAVCAD